jgi:Mrp family chromosome partitioning ATPase
MDPRVGRIYTFYSFKGGVGRSMALANVAVLLARSGKSVLVVDWDLEAPGLHKYFSGFAPELEQQVRAKPGVVDMLSAIQNGRDTSWRDAIIEVNVRSKNAMIHLGLISAGKISPDYAETLQGIEWSKLYDEAKLGTFLDEMRREWRQSYDYVLIDSRTGVTDIGDICTVLLPDVLILLFVTNEQSIDGMISVMERAHAITQRLPIDRAKLITIPVLGRDEVYTEYRRSEEWRNKAADRLGPALTDWLPREVSPQSYFQKIFIPYVSHWSFGESLPVIENEAELENPTSISSAYSRLAALLLSNLDWSALASGENPLELDILKMEKRRLEANVRWQRRSKRAASILAAILVVGLAIGALAQYYRASRENEAARVNMALAEAQIQRRFAEETAAQMREQESARKEADANIAKLVQQLEQQQRQNQQAQTQIADLLTRQEKARQDADNQLAQLTEQLKSAQEENRSLQATLEVLLNKLTEKVPPRRPARKK